MPYNRKQRRAAAAAAAAEENDNNNFDPSSIPLARPPDATRNQRQAKTLFEIAAERQEQLNQFMGEQKTNKSGENKKTETKDTRRKTRGRDTTDNKNKSASLFDLDATQTQFLEVSPSGEISSIDPNDRTAGQKEEDEEEDLPPIIDTLFLSVPLTTVHFTLAFLAAHQYVENIDFRNLLRESAFIAFPVLTFCIHLAHGHIISFTRRGRKNQKQKSKKVQKPSPPPSSSVSSIIWHALIGDFNTPKTFFFLPLAILLGGLLVRTTNEAGYYAVMKRTPSIGTMWVWCVLEISSPLAALLAVLIPLGWGAGVMGYAIY